MPRSSSQQRDGAADAVLWCGDQSAGPVRLPESGADTFVAEFNKIYAAIGLKMTASGTELQLAAAKTHA